VLYGPGNGHGRRDRPIRTGRRDRPIIQLPSIALRAAIIVGVALVLFGIILFRLWFLQILSGQQFVAQANDNRLRPVKIVAPRGTVTDRNGEVIVANRPGIAIGIRLMDVPAGRLDAEVVDLSRVLHMDPARMRREIVDHLRPSWPIAVPPIKVGWKPVTEGKVPSLDLVVVKEDVSRAVYSYILEHAESFPGVEVQKDYLRDYPHGDLAAHLLGNLGEVSADELKMTRFKGYAAGDVVGQSGLEWTYDRWLRGRDGVAKVQVDAAGRPTGHGAVPGGRLPEPGDTLVTTLDTEVQQSAQQALQYGVHLAQTSGQPSANGGAAVVLDARNGEVVAMASYPTFDPSEWVGGISTKVYNRKYRAKSANTPLLDRAIQETKAVGSTLKPVDAIAAVEEGVITPGTSFFCPGWYVAPNTLDNHKFKCWYPSGHGTVDLVQAITESCDVYFYNVGYLFYQRRGTELEDWAGRMGFGKLSGIDIPGEASGRVPTPDWKRSYFSTAIDKIWKPGDSINLAVGQGYFEATPLQLAVAYSAIANGGSLVTPHLGLKIVDPQGQTVRTLGGKPPRKVDISQSTLEVVHRGLLDAANSPLGTSYGVFAGYPVTVAGKTGTAEVYDAGVMHNVDYAWYASYAPASDPKYVVVVMIEKGGHGGATAAPAARLIYDQLFKVKSSRSGGAVRSD
jgi:penicillin-binding protein 2